MITTEAKTWLVALACRKAKELGYPHDEAPSNWWIPLLSSGGAERCRMSQGRRHFTDEFKREAVALLVSSGRPLSQIASELGISPSMLRNWRNGSAGSARRPIPASAPHPVPDPAAEISRLRRENDRLRMERDILKKAVAIFSEPPR